MIALDRLSEAELRPLERTGVPTISGLLVEGDPRDQVINQSAIGHVQVEHLASLGHRHLAYATVSVDGPVSAIAADRLAGARKACVELGLPPLDVAVVGNDGDGARSAVARWLRAKPEISAIAAFNDLVAIALLSACRSANVDVPSRLAVIGMDDIPAGALVLPALSTVSLDLAAAANDVAARALALLDVQAPGTAAHDGGRPTVVRRAST